MKHRILLGVFCTSLLVALPALASLSIGLDQEGLVAHSDAVIEGNVTGLRSYWNPEHTVILTDIHIQVAEQVLGKTPDELIVRVVGGQVGKIRVEAEGTPFFERGQAVLLFLEDHGDGSWRVVADQQGEYLILTDKSSGERVAVPALDPEVMLLDRPGKAAERPLTLSVDTFKDQIRGLSARLGQQR